MNLIKELETTQWSSYYESSVSYLRRENEPSTVCKAATSFITIKSRVPVNTRCTSKYWKA